MKLQLLAALMLSAVATPALAEEWVLVSASADGGAAVLIDVDSMTDAADGTHGMRLLTVLKVRTQSLDALISEVRIDCSANTIRVGRTSSHDATGKQLAVEEDRPEFGWDPVKDGSNYGTVAMVACGKTEMPTERYGAGVPVAAVRERLEKSGS